MRGLVDLGAMDPVRWPTDHRALKALQGTMAALRPPPLEPSPELAVGGCFVCFGRGGAGRGTSGEPGWAGAVVMRAGRLLSTAQVTGISGAEYRPGQLAAREGPLLTSAVEALEHRPDVLLVNATGRDHPRRAGLALHLGWVLDIPSVGVTHRPLMASGEEPGPWAGSSSPLWIDGEQVGWWLRTRRGARPVAVSAGWRTELDTALELVGLAVVKMRTPEPLRVARRLARTARAG